MLKRFSIWLLAFAISVTTAPEGVVYLSSGVTGAEAGPRGHGGGFSAAPRPQPGGARTRPAPAARPSTGARPATRPSLPAAQRPSTRPAPVTRPANPGATRPVTLPARPGTHPPGARPPGSRPPGALPPGARPPGARPPGARPPGARPPVARPPVARPPGYRPPNSRPPYYRPPYYRPPYYRPPNPVWGDYYWNPNWGWYFTAALVGSTLVYAATLPEDKECEKVVSEGETLYSCDGVLYRSTYYKNETVYEIVSDPEGAPLPTEPTSVVGLSLTDPLTRGSAVRDLQNRLVGAGYDVGTVDGVFGSATRDALEWYQYDSGLEVTGTVDVPTAEMMGFRPPGQGASPGAAQPQPVDGQAVPAVPQDGAPVNQ